MHVYKRICNNKTSEKLKKKNKIKIIIKNIVANTVYWKVSKAKIELKHNINKIY